MKISDIKNEDAIDLLADIIEPASKIFSDPIIREEATKGANKITIIKTILKKHKSSIVEIFARLNGVPVSEYSCSIVSLTKDLLELFNDKELIEVFTSAEQKTE